MPAEKQPLMPESPVGSIAKLDLRGVILPVALFNCCRSLLQLNDLGRMEILISDSEAADMIVRVIEKSHDRYVHRTSTKDHFRIQIGPERRLPDNKGKE